MIEVPILAESGDRIGFLLLAKLPRGAHSPTLRGSVGEVVEGAVYRFEVRLETNPDSVVLEPAEELFSFDAASCLTGRFQPAIPRTHLPGLER